MSTQEQDIVQLHADTESNHEEGASPLRQPFTPPKLTFIVPKLVKRGGADDILIPSFISADFSP